MHASLTQETITIAINKCVPDTSTPCNLCVSFTCTETLSAISYQHCIPFVGSGCGETL